MSVNCNDHLYRSLAPHIQQELTRRTFLKRAACGIGMAALGTLLNERTLAAVQGGSTAATGGLPGLPHFKPKAKRIIYLFQSGAPSQIELFDHKPRLQELSGQDLPESVRLGQRLTTMTSGQKTFPIAPSVFKFDRHGQSGAVLSELLPHTAGVADQICFIKSLYTEAINHDPAITFFQTGSQIAGRPSMGSWVSYGLGSENQDFPAFVVLTSRGTGRPDDQPLYDRLWAAGFLPTRYQGVKFRNTGDSVVYLSNPPGIDRAERRDLLNDLDKINQMHYEATGDPEITTRISQYEMAFRMQASVPDLLDISKEPTSVLETYGPEVRKHGTYAANCLLARRLCERNVRFIQLYHQGWDQHGDLPNAIRKQCYDTDQPTAALLKDLQQRGLLEDTLIVWGGEFGRTVYSQGSLNPANYGRDHHPRCFTVWMAGAGVKPGMTLGETDDFCYNVVKDPVHVHDLQATILHLMGVDHTRLTYRYQGRDFRLTDVSGQVVNAALA